MKQYRILMLTTLIISGCSMVYELIISAVSSYLVGDSTLQYSVTIGLYMFAMGVGSYISKFMKKKLFNWFVNVEIGVGIVGGVSSLLLFLSHLYISSYQLVMYAEIIVIGLLVGAEIPLLTRIIEADKQNLRLTLSSLFSFDYIGGLIGAIAFPLLLLPSLGYFATAFLTGSFNILMAMLIVFKFHRRIDKSKFYKVLTIALFIILLFGAFMSEDIGTFIENGLYRDNVILSEQTRYQKIIVTRHKDDIRLYIDGNVQFSSMDEYRYHEALVHIPMQTASARDKVLVLGGGDGMAARELLKYPETQITLVDLDDQMTELCSTDPMITKLNQGSLTDERVTVINMDAYKYLEGCTEKFDVIIVDLPDPNNEALNKLYSNVFYRLCANRLSEGGVINVQSTSPYYATRSFWCVNKTLESEGLYVKPYHLQVPAFGDWGFNMASKEEKELSFNFTVETRYLTNEDAEALFYFGKDERPAEGQEIEVNRLTKPVMITYYNEAVRNWE